MPYNGSNWVPLSGGGFHARSDGTVSVTLELMLTRVAVRLLYDVHPFSLGTSRPNIPVQKEEKEKKEEKERKIKKKTKKNSL